MFWRKTAKTGEITHFWLYLLVLVSYNFCMIPLVWTWNFGYSDPVDRGESVVVVDSDYVRCCSQCSCPRPSWRRGWMGPSPATTTTARARVPGAAGDRRLSSYTAPSICSEHNSWVKQSCYRFQQQSSYCLQQFIVELLAWLSSFIDCSTHCFRL